MVYKDSAGKEIHEGDSLMDLTPGFVGAGVQYDAEG